MRPICLGIPELLLVPVGRHRAWGELPLTGLAIDGLLESSEIEIFRFLRCRLALTEHRLRFEYLPTRARKL